MCILVSQLKAYQPPLSVVEPGTALVGAKWAVFGFSVWQAGAKPAWKQIQVFIIFLDLIIISSYSA